MRTRALARAPKLRDAGVTRREAEVLEALGERLTNVEIADRLVVSVRTVESHVSALLGKLGVADRRALTRIAIDVLDESGPAGARPLPHAVADLLDSGPFVGRSEEVERILDVFELVASRRRRRFMVVVGEAGVGKTRLAAEAAARIWPRATVVFARFAEAPLVPFEAMVEAVRQLAVKAAVPRTDPVLPVIADAGADRYAAFERFEQLLLTDDRPTILILDDAHSADPSSLRLVRHVLRGGTPAPLFVIATSRPEGLDPQHALARTVAEVDPHRVIDAIALDGLSLPDVEALAPSLGVTKAGRARDAWERSGGNAFLVTELLRHGASVGSLPPGARDSIVRRIAGLGPDVVEALTVAALYGETIRSDVVASALGGEPGPRLEAIARARGAGFLVDLASPHGDHRFAHAIVRDALLGVSTGVRRRELHLRLAAALEAVEPSMPQHVAAHRHAALPLGNLGAASQSGLDAAAAATARHAYEVAATFATMALDAIDVAGLDPAARAAALITRGDAHLKAGDFRLAAADFHSALDLAREAGRDDLRAHAVMGWSRTSPIWGRDMELEAALEEALAATNDPALRAELGIRLARALYYDPKRARRLRLARRAITEARATGRSDLLASVLAEAHAALWEPDGLDERTSVAEEAVRLARSSGRADLEAGALGWLIADRLEAGGLAGADAAMHRHAELADRLRQRLLLRDAEMWRAMRAILDARYTDAVAAIEQAREFGEAAQDPGAETIYWVQRYWLACERGDPAELDALVEPCERFVRQFDHVPAWRAALAMLHVRRADRTAAERWYRSMSADGFPTIPRDFVWLNAMTYLAEASTFLDDRAGATTLLELLRPFRDRVVVIDRALACKGSVARFLGLLAITAGDPEAAETHLLKAMDLHERMAAPALAARTAANLEALRGESTPRSGDSEANRRRSSRGRRPASARRRPG